MHRVSALSVAHSDVRGVPAQRCVGRTMFAASARCLSEAENLLVEKTHGPDADAWLVVVGRHVCVADCDAKHHPLLSNKLCRWMSAHSVASQIWSVIHICDAALTDARAGRVVDVNGMQELSQNKLFTLMAFAAARNLGTLCDALEPLFECRNNAGLAILHGGALKGHIDIVMKALARFGPDSEFVRDIAAVALAMGHRAMYNKMVATTQLAPLPVQLFVAAAAYGNMNEMKALTPNFVPSFMVMLEAANVAATFGHVGLLRDMKIEFTEEMVTAAAAKGHAAAVRFMLASADPPCVSAEALRSAGRSGHIDVLNEFRAHGVADAHQHEALCGAIYSHRLQLMDEMLGWFDSRDAAITAALVYAVKNYKTAAVARLIVVHDAESVSGAFSAALGASNGCPLFVEWLSRPTA